VRRSAGSARLFFLGKSRELVLDLIALPIVLFMSGYRILSNSLAFESPWNSRIVMLAQVDKKISTARLVCNGENP
jgi:hypothetical protein